MVDQRRGSSSRSRQQRGPGRTPSAERMRARLSDRLASVTERRSLARAGSAVATVRSRFTGRAAILVVVLAVLVISYASSLKAYLNQRHDIDSLQSEITERQSHIDSLQSKIDRWKDPAYVEQQARLRFGFTKPGTTSYVALDEHGNRIQPSSRLGNPSRVGHANPPTAWWDNVWSSVKVAGNPPASSSTATTIGTAGKSHTKE